MRTDPTKGLHTPLEFDLLVPTKRVPQGTILRPLLYVSLTLDVWKFCHKILFALIVLYDTHSLFSSYFI